MSTMAQDMPLTWTGAPILEQAQWPAESPEDLFAQYSRADMHDRLCLWLHHREARPELNLIEAELAKPADQRRRWLLRLLGLPVL